MNGKFSAEQKAIYDVVLAAQLAGIAAIRPGAPWNCVQEIVVKVLCQGLIDLGLINDTLENAIQEKAYLPFYMHNSGHWLGMDVHDVGDYKVKDAWRGFAEGMVLTVEPGIYINSSVDVDSKWHNIGVRIEDDILVTKDGAQVLSQALPKTISDIEAMLA